MKQNNAQRPSHPARSPNPRELRSRENEAPLAVWDQFYVQGTVPWQSVGVSSTTRQLLSYASGSALLEVGCGSGKDLETLISMGFDCLGLDASIAAIRLARGPLGTRVVNADFFEWLPDSLFDVVYDKGFFHGLAGVKRRKIFIRRVAAALRPGGLWITVCGSADHRRSDFCHGSIYLRDLVAPAEIYFEVLEIVKSPYGLADQDHEFDAWHAAFRRR
jgi:SAM-dependent methyltransferase